MAHNDTSTKEISCNVSLFVPFFSRLLRGFLYLFWMKLLPVFLARHDYSVYLVAHVEYMINLSCFLLIWAPERYLLVKLYSMTVSWHAEDSVTAGCVVVRLYRPGIACLHFPRNCWIAALFRWICLGYFECNLHLLHLLHVKEHQQAETCTWWQ